MSVRKLCLPLIMLMATLIMVSVLYGANVDFSDPRLKPETILQEIKLKGAGGLAGILIDRSPKVWDSILRKIATGERSWLEAAVALRPGTDAGASEMLELAVGEALGNNPGNVFQIAAKAFDLRSVCGGPDVDDPRYDSYELSMKAINHRINMVASIKDPSLISMSKECVKYLEESKTGIAQFYQIEKK